MNSARVARSPGAFRYVDLKLKLYYERWQQHGVARKLVKLAEWGNAIARDVAANGPVTAWHGASELWARHRLRWGRVRAAKRRRLEHRARHPGTVASRLARLADATTATDLAFERIEGDRASWEKACATADFASLLDLYQYYMWFGDFRTAGFFRQQVMRTARRDQDAQAHLLPTAVNSALERGHAADALALLDGKSTSTVHPAYVRDARTFAHTLLGDRARVAALWQSQRTDADRRFAELVTGRTIAVVGPAGQEEDVGAEIDAFDVVVRTNFNRASSFPPVRFGSRTDVAYYNHASWLHRRDTVLDALDSLRWVNLKGAGTDEQVVAVRPDWAGRTRVFSQMDRLFSFGMPMAIPNVLFDLLCFAPASIKLFSTDFYAGGVNYHETYFTGRSPLVAQGIARGMRLHEAFTGFLLPRALHLSGAVAADRVTAGALNLAQEQYAERLQQVFGTFPLAD